MKRRLHFIFLLLLSLQASAQEGFVKAYNFGYHMSSVSFYSMIQDGDEIVATGYLRDSIFPYQQGIFIAKLDTIGNINEFKPYFHGLGYNYAPGSQKPSSLLKLSDDSGYLFVGNVVEGGKGFLAKFDLEGDTIWIKEYDDDITLASQYHLLLETNTGFLIGGNKQIPNATSASLDAFLIKTDKSGNELWEQQYGTEESGELLHSLIKLDENEYVLGGLRGPGGNVSTTQIHVLVVDSLGNEKWSWQSDVSAQSGEVNNRGAYGLQKLENGNWVYANVRAEEGASGDWDTQGQFVVRDSNFNLLTERVYDDLDGQINHFYNLVPLADGDWLGLGSNRELVPPPSPIPAHNYGHLVRISNGGDGITSLGDTLWTRIDLAFPDSLIQQGLHLHSAVELPGGSIIAAGYFTAFGLIPDLGLLIKVNQHGCIDTLNCTPTNFPNIVSTDYLKWSPDLKVFPNPASHMIHYESEQVPIWDKVELLNMTGQVVMEVFDNKKITVDGLSSGLYILRLWKDGRFWTRKIVVE